MRRVASTTFVLSGAVLVSAGLIESATDARGPLASPETLAGAVGAVLALLGFIIMGREFVSDDG